MKKLVPFVMLLATALLFAVDFAYARGGGGGAAGRGRAAGRDGASERLRQARSGRDGQAAEERSRADDDEQLLRRIRASRQSAD